MQSASATGCGSMTAPVRGADCIASIARWSKRDGFGQRLAAQLEGMSAADDRSFTVRLKTPFPLLAAALGKPAANVCFIMPERVAQTDAFTQITDFTGSGPFRFLRDEWTPGSLAAYARFDGYAPRQEAPDFTAGGKAAHFDRVEWNIIPDSATAAAALQTGEEDWWQTPIADLLPQLRRMRGVEVVPMTGIGSIEIIRFNHLHPPFNDVRMRRAVLQLADQTAFMQAAYGSETSAYRTGVGVFTPGSSATAAAPGSAGPPARASSSSAPIGSMPRTTPRGAGRRTRSRPRCGKRRPSCRSGSSSSRRRCGPTLRTCSTARSRSSGTRGKGKATGRPRPAHPSRSRTSTRFSHTYITKGTAE